MEAQHGRGGAALTPGILVPVTARRWDGKSEAGGRRLNVEGWRSPIVPDHRNNAELTKMRWSVEWDMAVCVYVDILVWLHLEILNSSYECFIVCCFHRYIFVKQSCLLSNDFVGSICELTVLSPLSLFYLLFLLLKRKFKKCCQRKVNVSSPKNWQSVFWFSEKKVISLIDFISEGDKKFWKKNKGGLFFLIKNGLLFQKIWSCPLYNFCRSWVKNWYD